jgi:antitoxin (DNA-binding transcriptional repressor) of toxin-antitoxin stability system
MMRTITIREARQGLSHPEQLFAGSDEVIVTRRGEPVARILPINPRPSLDSLRDFLASQPLQTTTSEKLLAPDREDRC